MTIPAHAFDAEAAAPSRTITALCLIALIAGFVAHVAVQIPNIVLEQAGAGGFAIGASTAAQAVGIVVSGPLAVYLLGRAGSAHVLMFGCCIASIGLSSLGASHDVLPITFWRLIFAVGVGLMVIVSQHVVTARAPSRRLGTVIAVYALCASLGAALAPGIISLLTPNFSLAYAIAVSSLMVAAISIGWAGLRTRVEPATSWAKVGGLFRSASPSFWAAAVYGLIENGLLALLTVYALRIGYSVAQASAVAMAGLLGVLLLQMPIGHISDRSNPRLVLLICALASIACLAVLVVARPPLPVMLGLAFVLGGLCDAFYTVGLADMSQRLPKSELAAANACFVLFCGMGEIAGPVVAGSGLDLLGPAGFATAFIAVLVLYLATQFKATRGSSGHPLRISGEAAS